MKDRKPARKRIQPGRKKKLPEKNFENLYKFFIFQQYVTLLKMWGGVEGMIGSELVLCIFYLSSQASEADQATSQSTTHLQHY